MQHAENITPTHENDGFVQFINKNKDTFSFLWNFSTASDAVFVRYQQHDKSVNRSKMLTFSKVPYMGGVFFVRDETTEKIPIETARLVWHDLKENDHVWSSVFGQWDKVKNAD
jgi:hypothetical protein